MHSMHGEGQLADQSEELQAPRDWRPLRTCQFYRIADARTLEADSDAENGAAFAFGALARRDRARMPTGPHITLMLSPVLS